MSDFSSSLPVRTQTNGDVVIFIADGTTPSQLASVDTHGSLSSVIRDASGNAVTSQANGGQRSLDTRDQADGPVTPGTAASFSQLIGGQFNTALPTLTNTQQAALQVDSSGRLIIAPLSSATSSVSVSNFPATVDTNYGTVGASTIRTAAQIGNATGAADFNFGTVGAQTLRTAAQIGNATGAASFNAGATGAQTLRVAANLYDSTGTPFSATNPLPVTVDTVSGTVVDDFKTASAIAANASDNHDYTVTAAKTLYFDQVIASASGKAKMLIAVETGVATNVFTSKFVQFNSTAETNMQISLIDTIAVAAGVRVRVTMTNLDKQAQDLYSTICGHEI
ncbi:MAG TPA: hypothetical protein VN855_00155 [Candidatus Acidoferrum sp.]|nr:hypothetical protein [Candidatus Acidoferrum sp.]